MRKTALPALVAVAATIAAAAAEEAPGDASPAAVEETAPERDLAGCRLCPECRELNPPPANYCIYCGAKLEQRAKKLIPQAVPAPPLTPTPPTLVPAVSFGWSDLVMGTLRFSSDSPHFTNWLSATYGKPKGYDYLITGKVAARLNILSGVSRPFAGIEAFYRRHVSTDRRNPNGTPDVENNFAVGPCFGYSYNYGGLGSYLEVRAFYLAGAEWRPGDPYNTGTWFAHHYSAIVTDQTQLTPHLGFWFEVEFYPPFTLYAGLPAYFTVGPAFAF